MKKLFEAFEKPNLSDWKTQLIKELKSENTDDPTAFRNEIEELTFKDIYSTNTKILNFEKPTTNDWKIGVEIQVSKEKTANQFALLQLNLGANALNFDVTQLQNIQLSVLLADIEIAYIYTYFTTKDEEQADLIRAWFADKSPLFLQVNSKQNVVNSYGVYAIGGNIKQSLAYALAKGKNLLAKDPNEPIHFTFGIGPNFLLEIAKFRAFQVLWNKIKTAYGATAKTYITAKTGFVNKSLQDPYTNLLRQTTEGLSAVLSGVDQLIIQPYDLLATTGSSPFSERMAINISLILKDEAEINQLVDPLEGSMILEKYTTTLADEAWELFQVIEEQGGINTSAAEAYLTTEIVRVRSKSIQNVLEKKQVLVGINNYFNQDLTNTTWREGEESFMGIKHLILEKEFENRLSEKL